MLRSGLSISLSWMIFGFVPIAHAADHGPHLAKQQQAVREYGQLPLSFTANEGQYSPDVAFQTRGSAYAISLARHEAIFSMARSKQKRPLSVSVNSRRVRDNAPDASADVRLQFLGASDGVALSGVDELPGKANFLIGNDPSNWRTGVPTYAKVKYTGLYPGIDLVYYGNQRQLEFDFIVHPGSDPNCVKLRFESVKTGNRVLRRIDRSGDLLIGEAGSEVKLPKPVVYQTVGDATQSSEKRLIDAGYVLSGRNEVHFRIGAYDKSKPLVIDPTLVYSSVFGNDNSSALGVAVDLVGNAYITGSATGMGFPTTPGVIQPTGSSSKGYAFISKLNSAGTALVYSTYLGGTQGGYSYGSDIKVDASGDAFVGGSTASSNFPTTAGAFQSAGSFSTPVAAFVSKLNPSGSALLYSTLLGGATTGPYGGTSTSRIAIDSGGDVYVAGTTTSLIFPTTPGAYETNPAGSAFLTKLNATGSAPLYSTYLPGTQNAPGLAVDQIGAAYLTGTITSALSFPITPGAAAVDGTAYVMKMNPAGSALVYSTYLQGHHINPTAIALDASGSAYVTGSLGVLCNNNLRDEPFLCVGGTNVPGDVYLTPGAYETTEDGFGSFVMKLNPTGSKLAYSTFLGNPDDTPIYAGGPPYQYFDYTAVGNAIAVDAQGRVYVAGVTSSTKFPVTATAFQATLQGQYDAFFAELDPGGNYLDYSTYLGGAGPTLYSGGYSEAGAVALDKLGNVYVAGATSSPSTFPSTSGTYRHPGSGSVSSDAFITKFSPPATGTASQSISFGFLANETYGVGPLTLHATASSGLPVMYRATGSATVQGAKLVITGTGPVTVTALQEGDAVYAGAIPVLRGFTVNNAVLEATADNAIRNAGVPNPPLTYTLTGFVRGDTSASIFLGAATLTTTANTASLPGTYPITFSAEGLNTPNYTVNYVPGILTVTSQQCETISNYAGGFSSAAGLSLNHGATVKGGLLQLTDGGIFEGRSAFYTSPVLITGFATDFTFQILNPIADGFTFTVQSNNPGISGHSGGDLGYTGIPHSAAIKFDIHNNQGEGPGSMGFYQNGVLPTVPDVNLVPAGIDLHSGHIFRVHIGYASANTAVTITDTQTNASKTATFPGDLSTTVGTGAYVGFTAGTGQGTATQNILSWSFAGGPGCH